MTFIEYLQCFWYFLWHLGLVIGALAAVVAFSMCGMYVAEKVWVRIPYKIRTVLKIVFAVFVVLFMLFMFFVVLPLAVCEDVKHC